MAAAGSADARGEAAALKAFALAAVLCAGCAHAADQWWAYDKGEHLIATTVISSLGTQVPRFWVESVFARAAIGFGAAVVVGAGKELLDLTGFGDPSWKDFTWDVIGAAVGTVISLAVEWVVERVFPSAGIGGVTPLPASGHPPP